MYRDYDQAALDLQYEVTAHYAGLEAFREAHAASRAAANAAARVDRAARLDVPYGAHAREKIDFFLAERPDAPLLIYIHGGYWRARDRSDFSFLAPAFLARGISLACVGYPLCPEVRLRRIVDSCRQAVCFIAGEAVRFGIDPARLHIAGHSAGGHLAAMMMATDWRDRGQPADLVKTGVAISGIYDLAPLALTKINADIHLDAAEIADLSPIRLAPRHRGPLIITAGGKETAEFLRQAAAIAAAWRGLGMAVAAIDSPGFHHFDVVDTLGDPGAEMFSTVAAAIGG
jgi:arylformamidase